MELKGVFPALVTPLTLDETVEKSQLRKVVRYCMDGGVYGVVVLGSTGEFPAMTDDMRTDAIETVMDEVDRRVAVLVGCGDTSTKKTITQVREAAKSNADGVLVALPYYYPLDQQAVCRHYLAIAEASELPVVLYNFPQMTKITIAPATVGRLAEHPNIVGIKDSGGDFVTMQRYLDATEGTDFAVMSGNPALGLAAYIHGAKGGIYAGCSLAPKLCVDVYRAFREGKLEMAVELQRRASYIALMGSFGGNAAVLKAGLSKLGICSDTVSQPLGLMDDPNVYEKIYAWMKKLGLEF